MGQDHTPKQRRKKELERQRNVRRAHDRILIVCEGSKTEPLYFAEIRRAFRLPSASIVVRPSYKGTAPIQVVEYAQRLFERGDNHKNVQPRASERVYAVFDRDEHPSYQAALQLAESLHRKLRNDERAPLTFQAVASVPSFELWLLLHFEDVHAPLHRDEVMLRLKRHIPDYDKGAGGAFGTTRALVGDAIRRARQLTSRFDPVDGVDPWTAMGELVALLTNGKI